MAKLRAVIWGVTEYEEAACDYKPPTMETLLTAQKEMAREDPISFCTPDNVHVTIESVLTENNIHAYPESDLVILLKAFVSKSCPVVQPEAISDGRIRAHWAQVRYHLEQLRKLLK